MDKVDAPPKSARGAGLLFSAALRQAGGNAVTLPPGSKTAEADASVAPAAPRGNKVVTLSAGGSGVGSGTRPQPSLIPKRPAPAAGESGGSRGVRLVERKAVATAAETAGEQGSVRLLSRAELETSSRKAHVQEGGKVEARARKVVRQPPKPPAPPRESVKEVARSKSRRDSSLRKGKARTIDGCSRQRKQRSSSPPRRKPSVSREPPPPPPKAEKKRARSRSRDQLEPVNARAVRSRSGRQLRSESPPKATVAAKAKKARRGSQDRAAQPSSRKGSSGKTGSGRVLADRPSSGEPARKKTVKTRQRDRAEVQAGAGQRAVTIACEEEKVGLAAPEEKSHRVKKRRREDKHSKQVPQLVQEPNVPEDRPAREPAGHAVPIMARSKRAAAPALAARFDHTRAEVGERNFDRGNLRLPEERSLSPVAPVGRRSLPERSPSPSEGGIGSEPKATFRAPEEPAQLNRERARRVEVELAAPEEKSHRGKRRRREDTHSKQVPQLVQEPNVPEDRPANEPDGHAVPIMARSKRAAAPAPQPAARFDHTRADVGERKFDRGNLRLPEEHSPSPAALVGRRSLPERSPSPSEGEIGSEPKAAFRAPEEPEQLNLERARRVEAAFKLTPPASPARTAEAPCDRRSPPHVKPPSERGSTLDQVAPVAVTPAMKAADSKPAPANQLPSDEDSYDSDETPPEASDEGPPQEATVKPVRGAVVPLQALPEKAPAAANLANATQQPVPGTAAQDPSRSSSSANSSFSHRSSGSNAAVKQAPRGEVASRGLPVAPGGALVPRPRMQNPHPGAEHRCASGSSSSSSSGSSSSSSSSGSPARDGALRRKGQGQQGQQKRHLSPPPGAFDKRQYRQQQAQNAFLSQFQVMGQVPPCMASPVPMPGWGDHRGPCPAGQPPVHSPRPAYYGGGMVPPQHMQQHAPGYPQAPPPMSMYGTMPMPPMSYPPMVAPPPAFGYGPVGQDWRPLGKGNSREEHKGQGKGRGKRKGNGKGRSPSR